MPAYAVAQLRNVSLTQELIDYIKGIDATLAPYRGEFIIHGGPKDEREGVSEGDLIVIAFDNLEDARGWYASPAYQALIPLRSRSAEGEVFLIDGVKAGHRAVDILSRAGAVG